MPHSRDSATNARFTALSWSSMQRNMMMAFLLTRTPKVPTTKIRALRIRAGVIMRRCLFARTRAPTMATRSRIPVISKGTT